ncbi:Variant-specific surface protein, partial [Giardia duodenalis]
VRVTHTSGGISSQRSGQGRQGCTRMGHSCIDDSAWWALLLLLQLVLHRCSAGYVMFMGGYYNISVAGSGVCREARDGACVEHAEKARAERAGAGERIDKQRKSETGRIVKAAKTCEEVVDGAPDQAGKCAKGKCISIGENRVCTQCGKMATEAPKNGVCTDLTSDTAVCATKDSGKCTKCAGDSFMYKGGCYERSDSLGATICGAANSNGVCTAAKPGYFVPPTAIIDATHDSVVSCGDTAGVTLNTKTYTGVAGCTACDGSTLTEQANGVAKCTACGDGKLVKTVDSVTSCIEKADCNNGYFVDTNGGKKCSACANTCKTCSGAAAQCTSCNANTPYLKKADNSQTGTCVNADDCINGNTYYADDTVDPTSGKLCRKCAEGGLKDCATCVKSADDLVCKECTGKKFGLNKKSCVTECPDNASEKSGVCTCNDGFTPNAGSSACTQCHSSCLTCSATDENSCTACTEGTHFLGAASGKGKCVSCGDATGSGDWKGITGCAKCTKPNTAGAATCTECGTDLYLKTETGGATSCVASDKCTGGFFPMTDTADSNKKKCLACSDGTNGIANCAECTAPAQEKAKPACTKCTTPNYLKIVDGTTTCVIKEECKDDYFTVDDNSKGNKCLSCGDTTGVTVGNGGSAETYTGVAGCATCDPPSPINGGSGAQTAAATCTECNANLYLKTVSSPTPTKSCVTEAVCKEDSTHFPTTDSSNGDKKVCVSCGTAANGGIDNCGKCSLLPSASGSATPLVTCTKCGNSKYLKADGTCVDNCASDSTEFAKADSVNGNRCVLCRDQTDGIADCKTCSNAENTLKCSACNNNKKPTTTGTACVACSIANCAICNKENVCAACTDKKLSPLKDACLDTCPAGTYDSQGVCTPCHTSCSSCSDAGESSCTACYPGSVLSKGETGNTGTCIPECTGRYAENCEAGMCTASIGGSKYCSKCKSGFVPVDGLCVSATTRAPTGCTPGTDGTCSACTDKYFLQSGGCYLSTAYPGSTLCSSAADGKCKTCANGQTADTSTGVCPACPAGCSKCSGSSGSQTCSECLAGYYKSGTKCVKCSENSTNGGNTITGVPNCVSCTAPTSNTGTVTCYVTQDPTVDPTDPSVNKGGLSSGAIAGISVAVIAVVGGLVGFLCWWFVCRGKA